MSEKYFSFNHLIKELLNEKYVKIDIGSHIIMTQTLLGSMRVCTEKYAAELFNSENILVNKIYEAVNEKEGSVLKNLLNQRMFSRIDDCDDGIMMKNIVENSQTSYFPLMTEKGIISTYIIIDYEKVGISLEEKTIFSRDQYHFIYQPFHKIYLYPNGVAISFNREKYRENFYFKIDNDSLTPCRIEDLKIGRHENE